MLPPYMVAQILLVYKIRRFLMIIKKRVDKNDRTWNNQPYGSVLSVYIMELQIWPTIMAGKPF